MLKVHILGSGNAGTKHRETLESMPELYTITGYDEADIIDICTPNYLHFEQAMMALRDGKDCIVEKPVCSGSVEFERLLREQQRSGRHVYPVLQYRNIEITDYAATWQRPLDYYSGWRGNSGLALGGVIMSHGIHLIDNAIRRYGPVESLYCTLETDPRYACDVETTATIFLHFSKNIGGDLIDNELPIYLCITPDLPQDAPPNPGYHDFFRNLGAAPLASLHHLIEVIDLCYASATSGGNLVHVFKQS